MQYVWIVIVKKNKIKYVVYFINLVCCVTSFDLEDGAVDIS